MPPVPPSVWPPSSGEMAVGLGLVKRKCEVGPSAGIWAAGRSERQALLWCPRGPPRPAPPRLFCSQTELRLLCLTRPPRPGRGPTGHPSRVLCPQPAAGRKLGHQIDKAERPGTRGKGRRSPLHWPWGGGWGEGQVLWFWPRPPGPRPDTQRGPGNFWPWRRRLPGGRDSWTETQACPEPAFGTPLFSTCPAECGLSQHTSGSLWTPRCPPSPHTCTSGPHPNSS